MCLFGIISRRTCLVLPSVADVLPFMSSPTRASAHRRQLEHFTRGTVTKPEDNFTIFSTLTLIPINVFFQHALNESIIGLLFVCLFVSCVLSVGGIRVC